MKIVISVFSLIPFIIGCAFFVYYYMFIIGSYTAPAEVIDVRSKLNHLNILEKKYYPVYKFKYSGIDIIRMSKVGYNGRNPYKIGDIINVRYNAHMNLAISKDYNDFITLIIILLSGGLLIFLAVVYFMFL